MIQIDNQPMPTEYSETDIALSSSMSLNDGTPDFASIERLRTAELPAVRRKLINLRKLKSDSPAKHSYTDQRRKHYPASRHCRCRSVRGLTGLCH